MSMPLGSEAAASGAQKPASITAPARIRLWEEARVAYLSINPPLDAATLAELTHILDTWQAPADLKAFVLDLTTCTTSSPPGAEGLADKKLLESRQGRVRERALAVAQDRALAALSRLPTPILGVASGAVPPIGCTLLSCCDVLLAAQETVFISEGGSLLTYHHTHATRASGTGPLVERVSAHQAHRQGLINWLAPADQLPQQMDRILRVFRELSATSLALAKRAFLIGMAYPNAPEIALEQIGNLYLQALMATPDATEGLQAFLEKRPPVWQETLPKPQA